jgi:NADPH2:quinone reductase
MSKRVVVKQFGGPEVLQIESADDLVPRDDQILVRVEAFGINPVETYIRSGLYDPLPSLPYTPGNDASGIVVSVGSELKDSSVGVGDRVWITGSVSGTYAQYCVCNPKDVHRLPSELTFAQGASVGIPYRTAYRALVSIAKAKPGESVLVHGATGGVGLAALQVARMLGLSPIVGTTSSRDESTINLLRENGATVVMHHDDADLPKVHVIIEMVANVNLGKDIKLLNKSGRVVIVGNRGEVTINPRDLMRCEGSIHGMVGPGTPEEREEIDAAIQQGLESGQLKPVVSEIYNLASIAGAHEEVISHSRGTRGKIVVNPFH